MSGGAGYVLSNGALLRLGSILAGGSSESILKGNECNLDKSVGYEDLELGKIKITKPPPVSLHEMIFCV